MAAELGFLLQRSTQQNNISPVCFKGVGPAVFPQRARGLLKNPLRSANAWRRRGLAQRLAYQQLMCVTSCSGVLDGLLMLLRVAVKFRRVNLGLPQPRPLPLPVLCQCSLAWWIRSALLCS